MAFVCASPNFQSSTVTKESDRPFLKITQGTWRSAAQVQRRGWFGFPLTQLRGTGVSLLGKRNGRRRNTRRQPKLQGDSATTDARGRLNVSDLSDADKWERWHEESRGKIRCLLTASRTRGNRRQTRLDSRSPWDADTGGWPEIQRRPSEMKSKKNVYTQQTHGAKTKGCGGGGGGVLVGGSAVAVENENEWKKERDGTQTGPLPMVTESRDDRSWWRQWWPPKNVVFPIRNRLGARESRENRTSRAATPPQRKRRPRPVEEMKGQHQKLTSQWCNNQGEPAAIGRGHQVHRPLSSKRRATSAQDCVNRYRGWSLVNARPTTFFESLALYGAQISHLESFLTSALLSKS